MLASGLRSGRTFVDDLGRELGDAAEVSAIRKRNEGRAPEGLSERFVAGVLVAEASQSLLERFGVGLDERFEPRPERNGLSHCSACLLPFLSRRPCRHLDQRGGCRPDDRGRRACAGRSLRHGEVAEVVADRQVDELGHGELTIAPVVGRKCRPPPS